MNGCAGTTWRAGGRIRLWTDRVCQTYGLGTGISLILRVGEGFLLLVSPDESLYHVAALTNHIVSRQLFLDDIFGACGVLQRNVANVYQAAWWEVVGV